MFHCTVLLNVLLVEAVFLVFAHSVGISLLFLVFVFVTLFGKTGLNENRVQMHFNEFQMHLECITTLENDSQRICNVPQFIHETPPMFLNVQE